jgi:hypothetical protein
MAQNSLGLAGDSETKGQEKNTMNERLERRCWAAALKLSLWTFELVSGINESVAPEQYDDLKSTRKLIDELEGGTDKG